MILLTRLNNSNFYINPDLIETVEETPDTVISTTTGHKYVVKDRASDLRDKIIEYRRAITGPFEIE